MHPRTFLDLPQKPSVPPGRRLSLLLTLLLLLLLVLPHLLVPHLLHNPLCLLVQLHDEHLLHKRFHNNHSRNPFEDRPL